MAYVHHTWTTETDLATKIIELDAHIAEVALQLTASVASNGSSRDTQVLQQYHATLLGQREKLQAMPGATGVGTSGPRVRKMKFC